MKKLLLILPLLLACKTSKRGCDAYGAYRVPHTDTIVVSEYYVLPIRDNRHQYVYFPKEIIYISKDGTEVCIPVRYEYQKNNKR